MPLISHIRGRHGQHCSVHLDIITAFTSLSSPMQYHSPRPPPPPPPYHHSIHTHLSILSITHNPPSSPPPAVTSLPALSKKIPHRSGPGVSRCHSGLHCGFVGPMSGQCRADNHRSAPRPERLGSCCHIQAAVENITVVCATQRCITARRNTVRFRAVLCCAVLCCAVLCCAVLCCAVLRRGGGVLC